MGMHNFGEKRWGSGLLDDFRSTNDQNTRIIGDFTKMVRQRKIAERMEDLVNTENWQEHFKTVVADSKLSGLDDLDPLLPKLLEGVKWHAENAKKFKRQTLQTRFFETGDNYYLGMELTREYDKWKNELAEQLTESLGLNTKDHVKEKEVKKFQGVLMHHIDRLWYEACLEIIRAGDVYNPGARHRVPHIWLTKSYFDQKLGTLPIGESFRLAGRPEGRYEVMIKQRKQIIVRNVEGKISKMKKDTLVRREGDLTRSPDGNQESRVSLATFPVGHYINFRTVRLNNESRGYVLTFVGDEQATPHFMRYSGLTGACINAMLFNNFIKSSIEGGNFIDRFQLYSKETNWSNGEVVQRGTSSNYGEDGFLRPGFPYHHAIDYLHSKVIEYMETQQDLDDIISRDWKKKFAASMIPRGMELNENFIRVLYEKMQMHIFNKFVSEVDKNLSDDALTGQLVKRQKDMSERLSGINPGEYWAEFLSGLDGLDKESRQQLADFHCEVAKCLEQTVIQIVEFASKGYLYNERVNQELHNQPKPVDSIVDDFAVEAQNFANSLVMSAAFSAGALAFVLVDIRQENATRVGEIWAAIIAALNILISFGTMTNAARYKIRNEEARIIFFSEKFSRVKKAVFSLMDKKSQDKVPTNENPFKLDLEEKVQKFLYDVEYYNIDEAQEFNFAYKTMLSDINNPAKIRHFQKKLSGYFIADLYHVNSYVQESLVDIYKVCEDMHSFLTQELGDKRSASDKAWRLFDRLVDFTPTLDRSLQRGNVSWGFLKKRRIAHWDIFVVIRYFYSLICCACTRCKTPLSPIQTETLGVLKGTRDLSAHHSHTVLRREIRDLEYLYWATHESDVASLIFVSALLIFLVSWIFTISRIITAFGGPSVVTDVAFWATLASAFGAILAAFHFQRKFFILIRLECILGTKLRRAASSNDKGAIRAVKRVTSTQIFLTLTRLLTAYAAAVALPFAVVIYFYGAFGEKIRIDESIPFWIALGAVCAAVCATIFFFVVEYIVRYNLSPKLGEYICEAFRDEIQDMYTVLSVPNNDIDTKQVQERETWEYVAREFLHKYRFDTVFAADRFGSILQYLQSGMDPRN